MNDKYSIFEVTKDKENEYASKIVELEQLVLNRMEKNGKVGQLFITDEDEVREYIKSPSNNVMVAKKNDDDSLISIAFITHGQKDFSYNDITKYFKYAKDYDEYVKTKYVCGEYKKAARKAYIDKIISFAHARDEILSEYDSTYNFKMSEDEKNEAFMKLVENARNDEQNEFQEHSQIRDELNKKMASYMKFGRCNLQGFRDFYWLDFNSLEKIMKEQVKEIKIDENAKKSIFGRMKKSINDKYESFINFLTKGNDNIFNITDYLTGDYASTIRTYDKIMQYQKYIIKDISHCSDCRKYYTANTANTIELDTYITHPDKRENGIARFLVLEGIKKSAKEVLKNQFNDEIFIASTLHEDNLSSKYVSEFFGLEDYIFVNRRKGRDRQIHFLRIKREDVPKYLLNMEKKIAVLYDYNPSQLEISDGERWNIISGQLRYELRELRRLENLKKLRNDTKFDEYLNGKKVKIDKLKNMRSQIGLKAKKQNLNDQNKSNKPNKPNMGDKKEQNIK